MGPSWKDIKHVQLLDPRETAEEKRWDEEFQRRQKELLLQRRRAEERRSRTSAKLSELSARWRRLESKRVHRSEEYMERLRTSISLMSLRDNSTISPHSVRNISEENQETDTGLTNTNTSTRKRERTSFLKKMEPLRFCS